ncbi:MAG TPA: ADP-forming succinate--CoA ligase subunit beta [Oligoflexia bacterium]|nr:ADP-forming succinate--CoA ligase subunit beta [Oligoflexia bacterium]HMR24140.1 ADP-forming succinate--CoA ligase subunit beta [Oligoflexia bacterium]
MNIHEYQAKQLFKTAGIPVLNSIVAKNAAEAEQAAKNLGGNGPWVVKAQVHAGGRGKAGGVKVCKTLTEVKEAAEIILSKPLVTHQTGPQGVPVPCVLVEEGCAIDNELYFAAVLDRETASVTLMASQEGGVEIEEVAEATPEKIIKVKVDPAYGLDGYQARQLCFGLGLDAALHKEFSALAKNLTDLFIKLDCSLVEINPLVITKDNTIIALDGKVNFDENALYRHKELLELRDLSQENERDIEAQKWNLNYIDLDGNIGCMVNGAGLAMATMDTVKLYGGEPANFLDVGGGATTEMVSEAFKILVSDSNVKSIFVNIFGGIMRCDVLAEGIVQAVEQVGLKIPLIVRLEGTNVEKGRQILNDSGLNIQATSDMGQAAQLAVASVK